MDVADLIIQTLVSHGVKTIYGVPGDYVLKLFDKVEKCSDIDLVCTAGEEGASFAADAHARIAGFGVCMVTFGVGALKAMNAIAGAYAEQSRVLIISGAPGIEERESNQYLHHVHKSPDTQCRMFDELCISTAVLDSELTAFEKLTDVLDAIKLHSLPGYIEVPRDILNKKAPIPRRKYASIPSLLENVDVTDRYRSEGLEVLEWMRSRTSPVVVAGFEIQRMGLQDKLLALIEREGWPCASSLSGKSVISERHPLSLGTYCGVMSKPFILDKVENSDGVLLIGMPLNDIDTGFSSAKLPENNMIQVTSRMGLKWESGISCAFFTPSSLLKIWLEADSPERPKDFTPMKRIETFVPKPNTDITVRRLTMAIESIVTEEHCILADVGDALFSAADIHVARPSSFFSSCFWASLGFALPAAIGAYIAGPIHKPVVITGDGSFLMCATELATLIRYHIPATVIILDNKGYGTERPMLDGPFNEVQEVDHVSLAKALGCVDAIQATSEIDVLDALQKLMTYQSGPTLLCVSLKRDDLSDALVSITQANRKNV